MILNYVVWDPENFMVMPWLVNSIETEVGQGFMFFSTVEEIRDVVNIAFLDMDNDSMLYDLKRKACDIMQRDQTMTTYCYTMNHLWQEKER